MFFYLKTNPFQGVAFDFSKPKTESKTVFDLKKSQIKILENVPYILICIPHFFLKYLEFLFSI